MIVVTGSTGNVGAATVAALVASGTKVRAFARDEAAAARRLPAGTEIVTGDFDDAGSVARALDGAEAVLVSSADGPGKVAHEVAVIEAAVKAGTGRIVKISTIGAQAGSPLPPFDWHGRIEERLRASGTPSVILRSAFSMTNLLMAAGTARSAGAIFAPAGEATIAMIDPRDTGAAAAVALRSDAYDGSTIELTGPAAITYHDVASALSAATGRSISYVAIDDDAARAALTEAGMPGWLIEHLSGLFALLRNGAMSRTRDAVRALTGRDPRPFADFARDVAPAFA